MIRYGHVGGNSNHYHPIFGRITIRNRKEAMQRAAGLDANPSQGWCPHPALMGAGQALHRAGTASLCHLMSGSHKGPYFIKQERVYLVVQSVASRISDQKPPWPSAVRYKRLSGMDPPAVPAQQLKKGCWLCQTSLEKACNQGGALLRASWNKDLTAASLLRSF